MTKEQRERLERFVEFNSSNNPQRDLINDVRALLAAFDAAQRELREIASMKPVLGDSLHGPRFRCQQCGHAWMPREAEHHAIGCAYAIARAAIAATNAQAGGSVSHEYESVRRKQYEGGAIFVPVCETCGRFVKADDTILVNEESGLSPEPNATCKHCGRTRMLFEGFM